MISTLKLVNPFFFCCFRFSFKTPREALLIYLLHTDIMLFQWTCFKLQHSSENCRENCHQINHDPAFFSAPYKYSTTVVLSRSMRFFNGHRPRINHPDWLLRKPIWFNQLITIANFRFFSVRDFNVTVLLLCELYTGFLQRINQFSSSVKFANGYYENQLTYSNRWWYFYMSEIYVWSMDNIFVTICGLN